MSNTFLSVVVPAYKEVKSIKAGALEDMWKYLMKQKYSWELLLVEDGSPDETGELIDQFAANHKGIRVMHEPHRGKGGTVIAGMLAAKGEIILFADMDQATPINQIEKLLPKFKGGYDVVIGSRSGRKGAPISRKVMAYGFMILRTIILRLPYKDTQCGFKAFKREASREIFKRMKIFSDKKSVKGAAVTAGFDLEVLYLARKLKYRVAEVPVLWLHRESERVNPIKDSIQGFLDLLKVRMNALTGKYTT